MSVWICFQYCQYTFWQIQTNNSPQEKLPMWAPCCEDSNTKTRMHTHRLSHTHLIRQTHNSHVIVSRGGFILNHNHIYSSVFLSVFCLFPARSATQMTPTHTPPPDSSSVFGVPLLSFIHTPSARFDNLTPCLPCLQSPSSTGLLPGCWSSWLLTNWLTDWLIGSFISILQTSPSIQNRLDWCQSEMILWWRQERNGNETDTKLLSPWNIYFFYFFCFKIEFNMICAEIMINLFSQFFLQADAYSCIIKGTAATG